MKLKANDTIRPGTEVRSSSDMARGQVADLRIEWHVQRGQEVVVVDVAWDDFTVSSHLLEEFEP